MRQPCCLECFALAASVQIVKTLRMCYWATCSLVERAAKNSQEFEERCKNYKVLPAALTIIASRLQSTTSHRRMFYCRTST